MSPVLYLCYVFMDHFVYDYLMLYVSDNSSFSDKNKVK